MFENISFNDEDLKAVIISYWKSQGVTINENTAQQLTQEVRAKLKQNTEDELKLALSEMKMELSPTVATSSHNLLSLSMLNSNKKIYNLVQVADFRNMERNEITEMLQRLANYSNASDKTIKEQRRIVSAQVEKLRLDLLKTEKKIKSVSESPENYQKEIQDLATNDNLKSITQKEHVTLGKARASKEPESKKVGYSPEEVNELNKAFSPRSKDNEGNTSQQYTKNLPTISFNEELQQGRSNERLLWTRKRFAYEKYLGREDSPLYAKRLAQYRGYIENLMSERFSLNQLMVAKKRVIIATGNIEKQTMATSAIEHYHSDSMKGKNFEAIKLKNLLVDYVEKLRKSEHEYLKTLKGVQLAQEDYNEVERKIDQFIQSLENDTEAAPIAQQGSEEALFDPEYIFTNGRRGREGAEGETAKFRQQSKLSPNDWSFKNLEQNAPEVAKEMENQPTTWRKGWAIFNWGDKLAKSTKTDIDSILKPKISPKITQEVQLSPYASDSEKDFVVKSIDKFNRSGMNDETKANMAVGPWNWAILWNLSKDKISKQTFMSQLYGENNDVVNLPNGVKALTEQVYKQYPKINSEEIRMAVVTNPNTPDWILMYVAQHDRELETLALNELGKKSRGWKVKRDENKNPVIFNGDWVWEKLNIASLRMSYRESQLQDGGVNSTQESPQFQQLVNQQDTLNNQDKSIQDQRQQLQRKMNQMKNQQPIPQTPQTTPAQAVDNTTAIPGSTVPPTMANNSWKILLASWRNKILGR